MKPWKMTEETYRQAAHNYDGICLSCGEVTCGGVEPDARNYNCDACGALRVWGLEMALVAGYIEIEESTEMRSQP